jgi:hypothetical protein
MKLWYKVAMPQGGVREGRSFHPDNSAIPLEGALADLGPSDRLDVDIE